jgi:pimeloyl-ACP methyl ester carboxylesterase
MTSLPIPAQIAELPGGLHLPYLEQGDPDGGPLILLHGLTDSHRAYEPVLGELPDSIHALAVTTRGHGDADKPDDGYTGADLAADVVAFMDVVGIERAVVAGHSNGAWVARRVAELHPERVLGVVLGGCFATYERPDIQELAAEFRALTDPIDPAFVRAWQESTLARPVPEALLAQVVEESSKAPARVWRAAAEGLIGDPTAEEGEITAPTLLIWGDQDAFVPRSDQDALLAAIPGAELIVHEGGGHAFHWEDPARYAAELTAFVASLARAS